MGIMKVLVIADVQGNLTALEAVLAHAPPRTTHVIGLGDFACGPEPGGVIHRLRALGVTCVRGNMDEVIAAPPTSAGAGDDRFAEIDAWCSSKLTSEERTWLAELPLAAEVELPGGMRMLACHGSPSSITDAIGADTPAAEVSGHLQASSANVLAVGHLHDPMLRVLDDAWVLNPGSVGWPSPQADGLRPTWASYAVLDIRDGSVRVGFARVSYAHEALHRSVARSGMPHGDWYLRHWRARPTVAP